MSTRASPLLHSMILCQFYPPSTDFPRFTTAAELRDFFNDTYIPEKIKEAKFAESMHVEAYSPFMAEWEVILNGQSKLFCDAGSTCLSKTEQIALSNELLKSIISAVRPHFSGLIGVESGQTYSVYGTEWNQTDFSGFDNISFTLNPKCTVPVETKALADQLDDYFASQLTNFQAVMALSPKASWSIGEFFARPSGFVACGYGTASTFKDVEDLIYERGIAALKGVTWAELRGVGFDNDYIVTDAARARVRAYLDTL